MNPAITIPIIQIKNEHTARIFFQVNDLISSAGIRELLITLGMRPKSIVYHLSIADNTTRTLTLIGRNSEELSIFLAKLIDQIKEIGDLVEEPQYKQAKLTPFIFQRESDWIFEPPHKMDEKS